MVCRRLDDDQGEKLCNPGGDAAKAKSRATEERFATTAIPWEADVKRKTACSFFSKKKEDY